MSGEREAIRRDVAKFHGWEDFHDSGIAAYVYVVQQALERESRSGWVSAYLEYHDAV